MKRYKVILKIIGLEPEITDYDTFNECENYALSRPYDWFKVYRDGILISNKEYNY